MDTSLDSATLISMAATRFKTLAHELSDELPELPFLRTLLADANVGYAYRPAVRFCQQRGILTLAALARHASDFLAEDCVCRPVKLEPQTSGATLICCPRI